MSITVPIEPDAIRDYLDSCIRVWREIRAENTNEMGGIAPYYIDAFQSVRVSMFGELLAEDES